MRIAIALLFHLSAFTYTGDADAQTYSDPIATLRARPAPSQDELVIFTPAGPTLQSVASLQDGTGTDDQTADEVVATGSTTVQLELNRIDAKSFWDQTSGNSATTLSRSGSLLAGSGLGTKLPDGGNFLPSQNKVYLGNVPDDSWLRVEIDYGVGPFYALRMIVASSLISLAQEIVITGQPNININAWSGGAVVSTANIPVTLEYVLTIENSKPVVYLKNNSLRYARVWFAGMYTAEFGATNRLTNLSTVSSLPAGLTPTTLQVGEGDNLGDHVATQNLRTNGHWISSDGGSEGVYVAPDGNVGIGVNTPAAPIHVGSTISRVQRWTTGNVDLDLQLYSNSTYSLVLGGRGFRTSGIGTFIGTAGREFQITDDGQLDWPVKLNNPIAGSGAIAFDAQKKRHLVGASALDTMALTSDFALRIVNVSSTSPVPAGSELVLVDAGAGALTLNLAPAGLWKGWAMIVKKTDATGNAVTLDPFSNETIENLSSISLTSNDAITIVSDGTKIHVIAQ